MTKVEVLCYEVFLLAKEISYSFHLGSDKNKSKVAKKVAKENVSGTIYLSNNAIDHYIYLII